MNILRAGIIGLGVGEAHIPGFEASGGVAVTALCDISPDQLAAVAARHPGCRLFTDPAAMIADPEIDVVSIASYDDAHTPQILAALRAGKHVFAEKPLCRTEDELAEIRRVMAEAPNLRLSSNLILRRSPRFLELRRRLRAGDLGDVYYLEGDYNYGRVHKLTDGWRGRMDGYSVTLGGGLHMIDLILWLLDERPEEVTAYGGGLATRGTRFSGMDTTVALLRYSSGRLAKVASNFACVMPHHHGLTVHGTKASFQHSIEGARLFTSREPSSQPIALDDAYPGMKKGDLIPSFIGAILGTGKSEVPERDVFDGMVVALAIDRSIREGRPVRLFFDGARND